MRRTPANPVNTRIHNIMVITTLAPESAAASDAPSHLTRAKATVTALKDRTKSIKVNAPTKKAKKAKVDNAYACDLIEAARICGVLKLEFGTDLLRQSAVVKLPAWAAFKATLSDNAEGTLKAQAFHAVRDALEILGVKEGATMVLHRSGAAALYFRF